MKSLLQLINEQSATFPDPSTAKLDAEILLAHLLGKNRTWLRTFSDYQLSETQLSTAQKLFDRRAQGEPVAYIIGEWEFFSLNLKVTPDTLVPRPETELLVERAIALCAHIDRPKVLDLGTGTGAIAIAFKQQLMRAEVTAVDKSEPALEVAKENAATHGCDIRFLTGSWFEPLNQSSERFDLILSNPPYVAADDPHLNLGDLPFEPLIALTAGSDEFADLAHIINQSIGYMNKGGYLLVEHGYNQGEAVREIFVERGYQQVHTHRDYGRCERFSEGIVV